MAGVMSPTLAAIQARDKELKDARAARLEAARARIEVPAKLEDPLPKDRGAIEGREPERLQGASEYYRSHSFRGGSRLLPEEKYHLAPEDIPEGCACVWVPLKVFGMDTGQLQLYVNNGWVAARACDFPQHSGYGQKYPDAIRESGRVTEVKAGDLIVKDEQMLFVRAEEMSRQAEEDRVREARERIDLHLNRLRANSSLPTGRGAGHTETSVRRQVVESDSIDRAMGEV